MIKVCVFIFLEIVIYVVGFCMGCSWIFKRNMEAIKKCTKGKEKFQRMFRILNYWMGLRYEGKSMADYLIKMQYSNVAIYGMGHLGKHLLKDLKESAINVNYIIDKRVDNIGGEITIYNPTSELPTADVIIVTAIADFDEIEAVLESKVDCPIISLEDMVYEL